MTHLKYLIKQGVDREVTSKEKAEFVNEKLYDLNQIFILIKIRSPSSNRDDTRYKIKQYFKIS